MTLIQRLKSTTTMSSILNAVFCSILQTGHDSNQNLLYGVVSLVVKTEALTMWKNINGITFGRSLYTLRAH